jgi:hypothetical protein
MCSNGGGFTACRQYVLIKSMSQATLSLGVRTDGASVDAGGALATSSPGPAGPWAEPSVRRVCPFDGGQALGAGTRAESNGPGVWPTDWPREAVAAATLTGSLRSVECRHDHGRRWRAQCRDRPPVNARAPC